MKKLILAVTVLALTLMAGAAFGTTADMIAGNPSPPPANVVGTVEVTNDGTNLTVTYTITDPDYIITSTHLHVTTIDPAGLANYKKVAGAMPQTKQGNAIPGQFDYSSSHLVADGVTVKTHVIPLADIPAVPGQTLYVAAHAIVGTLCPCDEVDLNLPEEVIVSVWWSGDLEPPYLDAFFKATVTDTSLTGDYPAYCVDTDRVIRPLGLPYLPPGNKMHRGIPLQAEVFSSLDCGLLPDIIEPLVDDCSAMGKVNWILNNIAVGDPSPGCAGAYTFGDIQRAIWELLEDTEDDSGLDPWSTCRVAEIIAAAEADEAANGVFMPICGEEIGIIILPYVYAYEGTTNTIYVWDADLGKNVPVYDGLPAGAHKMYLQPIIIKIPVPCCFCGDTAWAGVPGLDAPEPEDGDGYTIEFLGKDWSMYFIHTITAP